ncbi:MAG: DUF4426 domain-containing protein [Algicola sp.]|nr:DUF4426 domain-containing protein [Algicola sp.]
MLPTLLLSALLSIALLASTNANAEQMKKLGNWNVHYIAFGATFLTPEIAKAYGIVRSRYKGVVNISVLNDDMTSTAQKVTVSGVARNLIGNQVDLEFKEIVEGKSVYYIAQIDYSNAETFRFEITVKQGSKSESFKFSQIFYAD